MKKILSAIIVLALALSLSVITFADVDVPDWTPDNQAFFSVSENGELIITGNDNSSLAYKDIGDKDFTLELEVAVPLMPDGTDCKFVIGVACTDSSWLSGYWYRFHTNADRSSFSVYFNDGTDGSYDYIYADSEPTFKTGEGQFNKMKVVKNGNIFKFYFNNELISSNVPAAAKGNRIAIGVNHYDATGTTEFGAFTVKNIKITVDGETAEYFTVEGGDESEVASSEVVSSEVASSEPESSINIIEEPTNKGCGNNA